MTTAADLNLLPAGDRQNMLSLVKTCRTRIGVPTGSRKASMPAPRLKSGNLSYRRSFGGCWNRCSADCTRHATAPRRHGRDSRFAIASVSPPLRGGETSTKFPQ